MKFLSAIAASLAAYATAQQATSFRGSREKSNDAGQYDWKNVGDVAKPTGGKKQSGVEQWRASHKKDTGGKTKRTHGKKCTVDKRITQDLQQQYANQFKALDVNNNNSLDSSEFKDAGDKIEDAFQNFRKGKKPSWYKGKGGGKTTSGDKHWDIGGKTTAKKGGRTRPQWGGRTKPQKGDRTKPQKGDRTRPQRGGRGRGGKRGDKRNGKRQLQDSKQSNFWQYLKSHGFGKVTTPKQTQSIKDRLEAMLAARVFNRFDRDHNKQVSLCEYENAMYRTQKAEKAMKSKKNDDVVVVHG